MLEETTVPVSSVSPASTASQAPPLPRCSFIFTPGFPRQNLNPLHINSSSSHLTTTIWTQSPSFLPLRQSHLQVHPFHLGPKTALTLLDMTMSHQHNQENPPIPSSSGNASPGNQDEDDDSQDCDKDVSRFLDSMDFLLNDNTPPGPALNKLSTSSPSSTNTKNVGPQNLSSSAVTSPSTSTSVSSPPKDPKAEAMANDFLAWLADARKKQDEEDLASQKRGIQQQQSPYSAGTSSSPPRGSSGLGMGPSSSLKATLKSAFPPKKISYEKLYELNDEISFLDNDHDKQLNLQLQQQQQQPQNGSRTPYSQYNDINDEDDDFNNNKHYHQQQTVSLSSSLTSRKNQNFQTTTTDAVYRSDPQETLRRSRVEATKYISRLAKPSFRADRDGTGLGDTKPLTRQDRIEKIIEMISRYSLPDPQMYTATISALASLGAFDEAFDLIYKAIFANPRVRSRIKASTKVVFDENPERQTSSSDFTSSSTDQGLHFNNTTTHKDTDFMRETLPQEFPMNDREPTFDIVPVQLYRAAMTTCANAEKPNIACLLIDHMKDANVLPDNAVMTAFFNSCRGATEYTQRACEEWRAYRERVIPDLLCWNAYLILLETQKSNAQVYAAFQDLLNTDAKPDKTSYYTVMTTCARDGNATLAWNLFTEAETEALPFELNFYNNAITALSKGGEMKKMMSVYQRMKQNDYPTNRSTYAALVLGCQKARNWRLAISILRESIQSGITPDIGLFNVGIHTCAISGEVTRALALFEEAKAFGLKPNLNSFTLCINAAALSNDWRRAMYLKRQLEKQNIYPDVVCYNAVIYACARGRRDELAQSLLNEMRARGLAPSEKSYTLCITGSARARNPSRALHLLLSMEDDGLNPTIETYNACIRACLCSTDKDYSQAYRLVKQLRKRGLDMNKYTYTSFIEKYAAEKRWKGCIRILNIMKKRHLTTDAVTYAQCIYACLNCRQDIKALDLFEEFLRNGGDDLRYELYLQIIAKYNDIGNTRRAAELAEEINLKTWISQKNEMELQSMVTVSHGLRRMRGRRMVKSSAAKG